jgi:hypothetical protein
MPGAVIHAVASTTDWREEEVLVVPVVQPVKHEFGWISEIAPPSAAPGRSMGCFSLVFWPCCWRASSLHRATSAGPSLLASGVLTELAGRKEPAVSSAVHPTLRQCRKHGRIGSGQLVDDSEAHVLAVPWRA